MSPRKTQKNLLITGCGRSGTKHVANFLRKAKFQVRHEQMGEGGTVSGPFVGYGTDAGDIPFNKFQEFGHKGGECANQFEFEHVWHVVRHPLKVIGSLRDVMLMPVKRWAKEAFGQGIGLGKRGDFRWAIEHYLITTKLAEKISHWRFRVEDLEERYPEMAESMGLPVFDIPPVSKTINRNQRTFMMFIPAKEIYASIKYPTLDDIENEKGKTARNLVARYIKRFEYEEEIE